MTDEWRTNSFCVSSTDSGRYTEIGEFQDSYEEIDDYSYQQSSPFANRFIAHNSSRTKSHHNTAMGVFLRNLKPIPIDPFLDPIFSTCFNCWQFGHKYHDCELPCQHLFCVNCGRMNVLIDSCPRCGRAYHQHRAIKEAKLRKQERANNFGYDFYCDYYDNEASEDGQQFETKENLSISCSTNFSETPITNLSDEEYSYYSFDESEIYYDDMIIDENMRSRHPVSKLLGDFLKLLNDVKHWPMEVQNTILLHFATERCKLLF